MSNIILCGCGALGSHIAMGIGHSDHEFLLLDDDTVASENIFTSAYSSESVGRLKAQALAQMLYRKYSVNTLLYRKAITNKKQVVNHIGPQPLLVIDAFDNIEARSYTIGLTAKATVHISIGEHGIGAIEWDDVFQLPTDGYARGENPVCTNELGRNLILFTSTVASVIINKYLSTGVKESAYVDVNKLEIYR